MNQTLVGIMFSAALGCAAQALGDSLIQPYTPPPQDEARLLSVKEPGAGRFFAVGQIRDHAGGGGTCTATLIAGSETPDPGHLALVITAGHCVKIFGDNTVLIDKPMPNGVEWRFTPKYFYDNKNEHRSYPVDKVVYATMKRQDIAVIRLQTTYGELKQNGIEPLTIKHFETPDRAIEVAHIPVALQLIPDLYLRYTECPALSSRRVMETTDWERNDLPWLWAQALPATGCKSIYGGASGSPFFEKGSNRVAGVVSTSVEAKGAGCGHSRPCEINDAQPFSRTSAAYFAPADVIADALRPDDTLDISKLDDGTGIGLVREARWSARSKTKGGSKPVRWSLHIEPGFANIRYKIGPAGSTQCEKEKGYSRPTPTTDQPLMHERMPEAEGVYTVCAIGQTEDGKPWQAYDHATVKTRAIDNTPPSLPVVSVEQTPVRWNVGTTITTNLHRRAFVKYGPIASTRCRSDMEWSLYRESVQLSIAQAPWRFCLYTEDDAGNGSAIIELDLRKPSIN